MRQKYKNVAQSINFLKDFFYDEVRQKVVKKGEKTNLSDLFVQYLFSSNKKAPTVSL